VRRVGIDDGAVGHARGIHRAVERVARLLADAAVAAAVQGEDRAAEARRLVGRRGEAGAMGSGRPAIEADHPIEIMARGGLQQADAPTDAEADRVGPRDLAPVAGAQPGHGRRDVVAGRLRIEPRDVWLVFEVGAALLGAGGPPVLVDGDRGDPGLGEPSGELLVVRMQPSDIGDDDDAGPGRVGRPRSEGREPRPVPTSERQVARVEGGAADGGKWRSGVGIEAHAVRIARRVPGRLSR